MIEQLVSCPKCGTVFDANLQRVAMLSDATRLIWDAGGPAFQHGHAMIGPELLAEKTGKSKSTIYYHLSVLVKRGLVVRVPQNRYKRVRHLYMGAIPNGVTPN